MKLISKSIYFRLALETDAEFILSLRNDIKYNKFISAVDDGLENQKRWLRAYSQKQKQGLEYYFIIHRTSDNLPIGTVRVYDFIKEKNSFCWGSWILNENKTRYAAIESAILIYDFAFGELNFNRCHMDMRKENLHVFEFHKRMGVQIVEETELDYIGHFYKSDYLKVKESMKKVFE